ncbi:hypothetical protein KM043_012232 [Ampulex compressa]|nr:hypothetical protein KM043_012232 [Ampulex compressa]
MKELRSVITRRDGKVSEREPLGDLRIDFEGRRRVDDPRRGLARNAERSHEESEGLANGAGRCREPSERTKRSTIARPTSVVRCRRAPPRHCGRAVVFFTGGIPSTKYLWAECLIERSLSPRGTDRSSRAFFFHRPAGAASKSLLEPGPASPRSDASVSRTRVASADRDTAETNRASLGRVSRELVGGG